MITCFAEKKGAGNPTPSFFYFFFACLAFFFGCSSPRSITINATFQMSIAKNKTVITAGAVLIVTSTILPNRFMNDMSVSEPRVSLPASTAAAISENAIFMPMRHKMPAAECGGRLSRIGRRGNNDNGERDEQGEREANGKGYEVALEFKQYLGNLGHIILVKNTGKKTVSREKLDDALYAQRLYDIRVIEVCVRIDGDYIREICDGKNCRREQRSHYPVESLHADRPFLLDYFFFLSHEELSATVRFMIRLPGVLSLSTQK